MPLPRFPSRFILSLLCGWSALTAGAATAEQLLARPELQAYHGWIKFLRHEAEVAADRDGAASAAAQEKADRLATWLGRIEAEPELLATLRGVQEWAYESPVDGSGQPFKVAIPTDYDPTKPAALSLYMHGWAGNHLEHATGMTARAGWFDVSVLGRARGGGYVALSEADVLHVLDYLQQHWSIDPDRIHLSGGSMGGGGTFRMASRYPHRWASGRPTCGIGSFVPVENLLTVPFYATHSDDDPVVSMLHAQGPLALLREHGGQAVLDATTGLGHAAWDYHAGNARAAAWIAPLRRPDSRAVRRIDYTALDGGATRAWWAEVAEWGEAPRPARFQVTAAPGNRLHAVLDNVRRLALRVNESPLDPAQPLEVVINGQPPLQLPAPLPPRVELVQRDAGWSVGAPVDEPFVARLHTPGGAALLYQGEPLLIVYGTRGDADTTAALASAAEAASRNPNPSWAPAGGEQGPDGIPHHLNLYGRLPVKRDVEVTAAEIARCHLVLIGSADENAIVARLADELPVTLTRRAIICRDGMRFDGDHLALGLVHYNPLAPDRLVFWVASQDRATYAPGAVIPSLMAGASFRGSPTSIDVLIMDATAPTLVATRSFDSRWDWNDRRTDSPLVPADWTTHDRVTHALGEAIREEAAADFVLLDTTGPAGQPAAQLGTTRVADVLPLFYYAPIGVMDLTGAEVQDLEQKLAGHATARWISSPGVAPLDAARRYRVALPVDALWTLGRVLRRSPPSYRQTELTVAGALERWAERQL